MIDMAHYKYTLLLSFCTFQCLAVVVKVDEVVSRFAILKTEKRQVHIQ